MPRLRQKNVVAAQWSANGSAIEIGDLTAEPMINVFVPTTPNPTSGFLLFVPEQEIVRLKMPIEDGLKLVVSGGIVTPDSPKAISQTPES